MQKSITVIFIFFSAGLNAQSERTSDFNYINWLQSVNTIDLGKSWGVHAEYQWRRTEGLKAWQQSLLRVGANYKLKGDITLHAGYAWIKTYPYGEYPAITTNSFPEHRIYEQLSFRHQEHKWGFHHRFRIEQRWLARLTPATNQVEDWVFLHRFRYQFRTQYLLWNRKERQLYAVFADELFIGAGKQLGENIFDQNRIFLLAGYKLNKRLSVEGGYVSQTLQQGRKVNDNTIIQRNNGIVLSLIANLEN